MKTTKRFLLVFTFILIAIFSKSQTPGTSCPSALSITATGTAGVMQQTNTDGWFEFTADASDKEIVLKNIGGPGFNKIEKMTILAGICGTLTTLAADSITPSNDTLLFVNISGLVIGNTYFINTLKARCVDCISDTANFNLILSNVVCINGCSFTWELSGTGTYTATNLGNVAGYVTLPDACPNSTLNIGYKPCGFPSATTYSVFVWTDGVPAAYSFSYSGVGNGAVVPFSALPTSTNCFVNYTVTTTGFGLPHIAPSGPNDPNICYYGVFKVWQNPNTTFTINPNPACVGNPVCFNAGPNCSIYDNFTYSVYNPLATLTGSNACTSLAAGTYSVDFEVYSTSSYSFPIAMDPACYALSTQTFVVNPSPTVNISASSLTICPGQSVTLTASGATSYTWLPSSSNANPIVVSPTATTTYTVIGANGFGCVDTEIITIFVSPPIPITAMASPGTICSGQSTTLTATGANTYTWLPTSLTGSLIVVTPTITTTYTVTGTSLAGCIGTQTVLVNVTPPPSITITPSSTDICLGASVTLTFSGGVTYTTQPGAIIGNSIVVTPTAPTVYTVTSISGACTSTATIFINVNIPNITFTVSPNPICAGQTSTISATGFNFNVFTLQPPGINGNNFVVTPSVTTNYTLSGQYSVLSCPYSTVVTLTVNPVPSITITATSNTICAGSSTSLTATGAGIYNWTPATGLSCTFCSSPVASPTTNTTYTVTGSFLGGCSNTQTISIVVLPAPTFTITKSANNICPGSTFSLTYNGAVSYTTNPGNIATNPAVFNPTVSTVYSVTASGANGCTLTKTTSVNVFTNNLTVNASPGTICSGNTSNLTHSPLASFTWQPGNYTLTGVYTVTPPVTTTYTLFGNYSSLMCPISRTITVVVNPTPTLVVTASPTAICQTQTSTLTASGAANYIWQPGSLIGPVQTVTPSSTTVYTVTGGSLGCTSTQTISITVSPIPTLVATASPTLVCLGSTLALSATGGSGSYTWSPTSSFTAGNIGSPIVITPTTSLTYTVQSLDPVCGLLSSNVTVSVSSVPSVVTLNSSGGNYICAGNSTTLSTNVTNPAGSSFYWQPGGQTTPSIVITPTNNVEYTVAVTNTASCGGFGSSTICVDIVSTLCCLTPTITWNTFTITAATPTAVAISSKTIDVYGIITVATNCVWGSNSVFKMHNGSKIIVEPGYKLTLDGCKFFSCNDIWEGIILKAGATGAQIDATNSSFEDAYKAIVYDAMGGGYSTNIKLTNCIFNKNYIGVEIDNCPSIGSGKFLFTDLCTYITTPSSTSPGPSLKCSGFYSPTIAPRGIIGINLSSVAAGLAVGNTTVNLGPGNYRNFFQNLDNGIYMKESGLRVFNARFRNMDGSNKAVNIFMNPFANIGVAIYAIATTASPPNTNAILEVVNGRFVNVWRGVATYGMNKCFTTFSDFNTSVTSPPNCGSFIGTGCYGNTAIIYNDAQQQTRASNNQIDNFDSGILSFFSYISALPTFSLGIGNNTITASTGQCAMGIQVMDGSNNFSTGGFPLTIAANDISGEFNGINVTNVKSGMRVSNNKVAVKFNGFPAIQQDGIMFAGTNLSAMDNNTITSTSPSNLNVNGIRMQLSQSCTVTCNRAVQLGNGVVYEGNNTSVLRGWVNNLMANNNTGFVIRGNGVIGPQGTLTIASGNRWLGAFALARTLTDLTGGALSSATNTPLYVNNNVNQNPLFGVNLTLAPGIIGQDDYHTGAPTSIVTVTASTFGCPTGLPMALIAPFPPMPIPPSIEQAAVNNQFNALINSATNYSVNNTSTHFLQNQHTYGAMKRGEITTSDATLVNFYNTNVSTCFGKYEAVDSLINVGSLGLANSSNAVAPTGCNIQQNHKFINDLLIKQLTTNTYSFSPTEVAQLYSLANKCPLVDGNPVYQARALYSVLKNSYIQFADSCGTVIYPEGENEGEGEGERNFVSSQNISNQILEIDKNSFLIFPNPNNGNVNLIYTLQTIESANISVIDVTGKVVYANTISKSENRLEINLNELQEGVYFYRIESQNNLLKTDKLVIIK